MSKLVFNSYSHLNKDDKVEFSIPDIAKLVVSMNYGALRFLTEIVKIREASKEYKQYDGVKKDTQRLRELIESGWY